jgi:RNA polymerase sigma-70 factor (ECF subfamily)
MTASSLALALPLPIAASRSRRPEKPMDEARFETFYRGTAGSLWSYIYRLTANPSTADDLLQKTFYRFLRTNPTVADDDHLRRYVFRTATNLVLDHFRETKRDRVLTEMPANVEARNDRNELRHDMARVFGELKPRERALLWLAHVEGYDHDEIGEALGIRSKSVRVVLFRARKRLAELLAKKGIGPEAMR